MSRSVEPDQNETHRLIRLGLESDINLKAGAVGKAITDLQRMMDGMYNIYRLRPPLEQLRNAIDELDAALEAKHRFRPYARPEEVEDEAVDA